MSIYALTYGAAPHLSYTHTSTKAYRDKIHWSNLSHYSLPDFRVRNFYESDPHQLTISYIYIVLQPNQNCDRLSLTVFDRYWWLSFGHRNRKQKVAQRKR